MRMRPTPGAIPLPWIAVVAAACSASPSQRSSEPADYDHASLDVRLLAGEELYADTTLALIGYMAVLGDKLVVVDALGEPAIHVVRRSDGEPLHRFGPRGEGPGEFSRPWSVNPVPERDDAFWVFDASLARLTLVELASTDGPLEAEADVFINLAAGALLTDIAWINGDFVAAGLLAEGRLERFDLDGNSVGRYGDIPETDGDYPPEVRQHAYQARMRTDPSRTRIALVTRHSDAIEVYAADGTLVKRARGPFGFEPRFSMTERGGQPFMKPEPDTRFGYVDVATTDDRIYALFSGRTQAGFGRDAPYAEYVHVYDWDGGLREVLKLDRATLGIAVDPQGENLYGTVEDPEPAVRVYALSES